MRVRFVVFLRALNHIAQLLSRQYQNKPETFRMLGLAASVVHILKGEKYNNGWRVCHML